MPIQFAAILPHLITAAAAVGSSILNNRSNKKLAQEQNKYNYNMWEKQNAYNLPSEQVARLKQAGINPNFYTSQVVSTNRADAAAPSANLANQNPIFDGSTGAAIADSMLQNEVGMKNAEANETSANAAAQNAETEAARQKVEALVAQSNIEVNDEKKKVYVEEVKQIQANTKNLGKQYEMLDEQTKQAVIKTARDQIEKDLYEKYGEKEILADLRAKTSQANLNISQAKLNAVTAKLAPMYLEVAKQQADAATLNAESNWMNAEVNVGTMNKQLEKIDGEIDKMVTEGKLNEAEAMFFKSFTFEKILGTIVTIGSFFIPGGAIGKAGKAVQYGKKAYKAAKVAATATKAQKAAGHAMSRPVGSYVRERTLRTVNPHM